MRINAFIAITPRINPSRTGIIFIAVALLITTTAAACGGGDPEELDIAVNVTDGKMTPETITGKQGDTVTLKIQGDTPGEFHLHTYDIETDIGGSGPTDMEFVADATGRYRITFHAEDGDEHEGEEGPTEEDEDSNDEDGEEGEVDLGFLEVQPR